MKCSVRENVSDRRHPGNQPRTPRSSLFILVSNLPLILAPELAGGATAPPPVGKPLLPAESSASPHSSMCHGSGFSSQFCSFAGKLWRGADFRRGNSGERCFVVGCLFPRGDRSGREGEPL